MSKHFFTTTGGEQVEIRPISLLDLQLAQNAVEQEFRERGEPVDPPIYEVTTIGGDIEKHTHTEKTIADGAPEEKAAWVTYLNARARMEEEVQHRTALVFLDGIVATLPDDDSWIKRRERLFRETVPVDPEERMLFYINKVLLKTPADQQGISWEITKLSMSGASQEAISAMEDLFRRQVEGTYRGIAERLKAAQTQEPVALQSASVTGANGESLGSVTVAVSGAE